MSDCPAAFLRAAFNPNAFQTCSPAAAVAAPDRGFDEYFMAMAERERIRRKRDNEEIELLMRFEEEFISRLFNNE